ncbi:SbcC-like subunit of palindrome specific endonuclease [Aeromonas phage GomatiRiver_11]|nr:exonuclease subunit 2 [Aeromonas phage AhFM11]WKW84279.1 SbcC-like subunit of palindrome specific endonuclease [Aeromonas phage GomatiRiver_11]
MILKKEFEFLRVRYKNIMSVGDDPIDITLDQYSKTLCTGKNGAGKSTMLEAIYFALFGKPFRDITKGLLVNTVTGKNLLVELWLKYENRVYHIIRGIKPNKFTITCDDKPIDAAASVKDFQTYFEDMIGMNATSFKQIVVLGTAGYTPFMQLKAPQRRKLVEDLLEVTILAQMDKLNKSKLKEIAQAIASHSTTIAHIESQLQTYTNHQAQSNASNASAVSAHMDTYNTLVTEAKGVKAEIDQMTEQMVNMVLPESPSDELSKFQTARYRAAAQHEQFANVAHMHEGGGNCPTCMQSFDDPTLVEQIKDKMGEIQTKLDKADQRIESLQQQLAEYNDAIKQQRDLQVQIVHKKQTLASYIEQAKAAKAAAERMQSERIDYSEDISKLSRQLVEAMEKMAVYEKEKYQRAQITELLKDSGIKAVVMAQYMPFFNRRIDHYLGVMEADFGFTLDAEFNEVITSAGRTGFVYNSFSQGEKARIDMAVLFAWRDLASEVSGVDVNALFMDEVFDGPSDTDAQSAVFSIIDSIKANVLIISHSEHDPQNFDRHLQMVKVGRLSTMKEDIFDVLQLAGDDS